MDSSTQPDQDSQKSTFSLLHNQVTVFAAVIALSVAIAFGLWKMLTAERTYRELVVELQSKTFGNKWIAAFELSKILANKKVPAEEMPWLLANLKSIYRDTADIRTREFVVVALSSLQTIEAADIFFESLDQSDGNLRMHALMALAGLPKEEASNLPWQKITPILEIEDPTSLQLTLYVAAHHVRREISPRAKELTLHENIKVRHAAILALTSFGDQSVLPLLKEIFLIRPDTSSDNTPAYVSQVKLNMLKAVRRSNLVIPLEWYKEILNVETDLAVIGELRALLNNLKN